VYDVAIIGGGPAGATLARLIGESYKVLLVDKRQIISSPESFSAGKCCGGLLAPDAQGMLSQLGLGLPKSVLEEPQLFVVKAIDIQQGLERYYQRHYININRQRFDGWLLSLIPSSVDIRVACRLKSYSLENDGFRLILLKDHKSYAEKAKILVGADGASSRVRSQSSANHAFPKRYFAIQEWVEGESDFPYFTSLFDPEITDYYCWTIPKGDHLLIGAALHPKAETSEKFELLKRKLRHYGFQFGKTLWREGAYILRPVKARQLSTGGGGIALLGEAGGWISPSSAEGISYAFRSALILAESLRTSLHGFEERYYEQTRQLRRNIFLKNLKSHFIFNPGLRKAVMRSGLQGMKVHEPQEGFCRAGRRDSVG
jgi:geranylgeranyl diphosphate/geranylgeranyl-bacteriochlorophyllide a reductase